MKLPLFILAGGFGTRLQSVLGECPKALAPVDGKPFLYLQIEHWKMQGCNSFIFLLHHQADMIISFLKCEENRLLKDCHYQFVVEPKPMGTGGAVAYALEQLDFKGDFLLTNADTWLEFGFSEMVNILPPAILVVKERNAGRYGKVLFDKNRIVNAFYEKSAHSKAGWINAGMSRLHSSSFENWNGQSFSLEHNIFPKLIQMGVLQAIPVVTEFIDIGIPEDYIKFCCLNKNRANLGSAGNG